MMMIILSMTSVDMPLPAPVSCGVIQTRHIISDPQLSSELHTLTHSVWVISLPSGLTIRREELAESTPDNQDDKY